VDKIKVWECVWTDEKLGSNGTQMEASPLISLCMSAIQGRACITSPCIGTKLFKLWPFEVRAIQELFPPGSSWSISCVSTGWDVVYIGWECKLPK
jgi:hypothetical protein